MAMIPTRMTLPTIACSARFITPPRVWIMPSDRRTPRPPGVPGNHGHGRSVLIRPLAEVGDEGMAQTFGNLVQRDPGRIR